MFSMTSQNVYLNFHLLFLFRSAWVSLGPIGKESNTSQIGGLPLKLVSNLMSKVWRDYWINLKTTRVSSLVTGPTSSHTWLCCRRSPEDAGLWHTNWQLWKSRILSTRLQEISIKTRIEWIELLIAPRKWMTLFCSQEHLDGQRFPSGEARQSFRA